MLTNLSMSFVLSFMMLSSTVDIALTISLYVLKRDGNFLIMTRQRSVWSEPVNLSGKRENMFFKFMIFSSH